MTVARVSDAAILCATWLFFISQRVGCSNVVVCVRSSNSASQQRPCPTDAFIVSTLQEAKEKADTIRSRADVVLLPGQHKMASMTIDANTFARIRAAPSNVTAERPQIVVQTNASETVDIASGIHLYNCDDVAFLDVDVSTESPGNMVELVNCTSVTFFNVVFYQKASYASVSPVSTFNSNNVNFTNCSFLGSSSLHSREFTWSALNITLHQFSPKKRNVTDDTIPTITLTDVVFEQRFDLNYSEYGKVITSSLLHEQQFTLIISLVGECTNGLTVLLNGCTFRNIQIPLGSPFKLHFTKTTSNNQITIQRCVFTENIAKVGAGMLVIFNDKSYNNSVKVTDTHFDNLFAVVQGGAVNALFLSEENLIQFTNCTFVRLYTDPVVGVGAAVSLYSPKTLNAQSDNRQYQIIIKDSQFINSTSPNGIIFAHRVRIRLKGNW